MAKLKMPAVPKWLDAKVGGRPVGVDRENAVLRGYVVAQAGPFKSEGRGEFDRQALEKIVQLGNAKRGGLKSRFTHPDLSSDGLGKFLGRARDFSMASAIDERTQKAVDAVRADLHLDRTAMEPPPDGGGTPLGKYVLDLAEFDPGAFSSSLVLQIELSYRLNSDGTRQKDAEGNELPPLWRPTELHASDIVDTGDAVDGVLSVGGVGLDAGELPDGLVRLGSAGLDKVFAGQPRDVVEARLLAYLGRYLDNRYGPAGPAEPGSIGALNDVLRRRLAARGRAWDLTTPRA